MPIMARIDMLLSIVRRRKYYEYGVENGVDNCYCIIRCCVYECMR
ncbi:hypothetical protein [Escherichia phage FL38]